MIKKLFEKYYLSKWLKENPEPLWTRGQVIVAGESEDSAYSIQRKQQYKQWSIYHSNWVRALQKYLNIKSSY